MKKNIGKSVKYKKVLFIPDIHAPFHDKKWLASLILFIKFFKPKTIFIMGDVVDFYAISKFVKDPKRALELQDELDSAHKVLADIKKVSGTAKVILIRGNHEHRLQRYLWTTAQELSGLRSLSVPELLELDELGIEYVERGRYNFHGIIIKHGNIVRKFSSYTAKAELERHGTSGVSAHTHRAGVNHYSNDSGHHAWWELGCGCRLDPEYMEGEKPNWQQGWGVGYFKERSKRFHIDFVPFVDDKAFYNGVEF